MHWFLIALLSDPSLEREETSAVQPDIWVWRIKNVPAAVKNAFTGPVPEDGYIIKLARNVAENIALEASLLSIYTLPLISRVRLDDGGVALLFGSDASRNTLQ